MLKCRTRPYSNLFTLEGNQVSQELHASLVSTSCASLTMKRRDLYLQSSCRCEIMGWISQWRIWDCLLKYSLSTLGKVLHRTNSMYTHSRRIRKHKRRIDIGFLVPFQRSICLMYLMVFRNISIDYSSSLFDLGHEESTSLYMYVEQ